MPDLSTMVLATGALGTAAFGIVEGLKLWGPIGEAGFVAFLRGLGPLAKTLRVAYGPEVETVLRAQYRGPQPDFARVVRQGTRIGLTPDIAKETATDIEALDVKTLGKAAKQLQHGKALTEEERNVFARFELAMDARIDAALVLAQSRYASVARLLASAIALAIALTIAALVYPAEFVTAWIVGLAAVPLAPVAKDVAAAVKSFADVMRARRNGA